MCIRDSSYGKDLIRIFNQPQGYPSAIVNRKSFDGSLFAGGNSWAGYINTELSAKPTVHISVKVNADAIKRNIRISAELTLLQESGSDAHFISIAIAENNIKDAQLTPTGVDVNYIHNHVMRKFLTPVQGNQLTALILNQAKILNFATDIPSDWNLNELYAVAIIHKGPPHYEIIQVAEGK